MRKEMISELCRFYQGEEKCPFEGDALKLWDIERIYFEALRDADKLSLAIAASFNAEVIDAIGRYYPSEKDELIARYNGSLREIIASVLRTDYLRSGERSHRCPVKSQNHSLAMR